MRINYLLTQLKSHIFQLFGLKFSLGYLSYVDNCKINLLVITKKHQDV